MPCYNSSKYIRQAIDSVLGQSFRDWELLIVDDNSTDNTSQIVQEYVGGDDRIKLLKNKLNSGPAVSRNIAITSSLGRFIAFLDSDDVWAKDKLEYQLKFMKKYNCPFSYAAYYKIDCNGEPFQFVSAPDKVSYSKLLKTCVIGCLTAVYDKKKFGTVQMPLIAKRQDYGLWLSLLKRTEFAMGIPKPLGYYRVHNESISHNKFKAAKYTWRLYRNIERLSFLTSCWYFSHYALRGVWRSYLSSFVKK